MLTATPDVLSDAAAIKKDAAKQVCQTHTHTYTHTHTHTHTQPPLTTTLHPPPTRVLPVCHEQARLEGHNNPGSAATVARIKRKAGGVESAEASGMSALESQAARVNREVAQQEADRAASAAPPSKRSRVADVTEQAVPKAVFGGLAGGDAKQEKPMGALERLKQKRASQTKT